LSAKLDQVQEGTNAIVGKIDILLARTDTVTYKAVHLETRLNDIDADKAAVKKYILKMLPPIGLAILGVLAGSQGPAILKALLSLFGR
jgi:hypothetical protein